MHTSAAKELTVSCYHCRCMEALTSHSTAKHANASKPLFLPQDKLFCTGSVAPTWGAQGETATPRYEWKLPCDPPRWQAGDALRRSFTFTWHTGLPQACAEKFLLAGSHSKALKTDQGAENKWPLSAGPQIGHLSLPQSSAHIARQSVRARMGRSATKGFLWVWHGCCSHELQQQKSLAQTAAISISSWRVEGLVTPLRPEELLTS